MIRLKRLRISSILAFIVLIIVTILLITPVLYMAFTSLKPLSEVRAYPPTLLPKQWMWSNYAEIFSRVNYLGYYKNSLIVACLSTLGTVFSSSFVAYGFARFRAPHKNKIFMIIIATLLLPYPALIIPQYLIFQHLGWVDTFLPLIVPTFFGSAYFIFLMRQFFTTVPDSLFEAAKIDGCNEFRNYWNIALPLCKPALASVAIFEFQWTWNDVIGPVIYLTSDKNFTLPIGMASLFGVHKIIPWQIIMTGNVLALLPLIILFAFAQKYFVEGITISGVK
ncbi:MAG: carbohydrate ABC transporter permease [Oscillospiraceae bacterium]|nr:carbohydrate ABC transporter permease [Oscillospiraceae bacterium]